MKVSILGGGEATQEVDLWPKEIQGLRSSAAVLRQTLDAVLTGR